MTQVQADTYLGRPATTAATRELFFFPPSSGRTCIPGTEGIFLKTRKTLLAVT